MNPHSLIIKGLIAHVTSEGGTGLAQMTREGVKTEIKSKHKSPDLVTDPLESLVTTTAMVNDREQMNPRLRPSQSALGHCYIKEACLAENAFSNSFPG
jgi:hypothetical protein